MPGRLAVLQLHSVANCTNVSQNSLKIEVFTTISVIVCTTDFNGKNFKKLVDIVAEDVLLVFTNQIFSSPCHREARMGFHWKLFFSRCCYAWNRNEERGH